MQITIVAFNDTPPIISPIKDTCVLEGTLLKFDVHAQCDHGETVTLTASGEPLILLKTWLFLIVQPILILLLLISVGKPIAMM